MGYHMDDHTMDLEALQKRLVSSDLIPSHQPLLENIRDKMVCLEKTGITHVAELRVRLKSKKSLASLAGASGIDPDYLTVLRRAVEGFFPKPRPLSDFDWLDRKTVAKLEQAGMKNTAQFYQAVSIEKREPADIAGLHPEVLSDLIALSDLSRVQWVSPTFARVLVAAGYDSSVKVANAIPEALYEAVLKANEDSRFYKGKVGQRDIKRLIVSATYVPAP